MASSSPAPRPFRCALRVLPFGALGMSLSPLTPGSFVGWGLVYSVCTGTVGIAVLGLAAAVLLRGRPVAARVA